MNSFQCDVCQSRFMAAAAQQCTNCGSRILTEINNDISGDSEPYSVSPSQDMAMTQRERMTAFSILFLIAIGCPVASLLAAIAEFVFRQPPVLTMFLVSVSLGTFVAAVILFFMKLFRAWNMVQPMRSQGQNLPTPGKAVGFLFIPFFNIYWVFVATVGLIRNTNLLLRDRLRESRMLAEVVPIAFSTISIGYGMVLSIGVSGAFAHPLWFVLFVAMQIGLLVSIFLLVRQMTLSINALQKP